MIAAVDASVPPAKRISRPPAHCWKSPLIVSPSTINVDLRSELDFSYTEYFPDPIAQAVVITTFIRS